MARKEERRRLARKAMRERGEFARRRLPGNDQ
jgi:MraZ protein